MPRRSDEPMKYRRDPLTAGLMAGLMLGAFVSGIAAGMFIAGTMMLACCM